MDFTRDALPLWADLYGRMADDEPGGIVGELTARDSAHVLRLAVAYCLTDRSRKIGVEHLQAAWAMWSYCRASVRHIFGDTSGDPNYTKLLQAVREAPDQRIDGTRVYDILSGHVKKEEVERLLAKGEQRRELATAQIANRSAGP
jgi:hypothetical protein